MLGRLEPLHLPLSSSGKSMRILSSIIQVSARPVPDIEQNGTLGDAVAAQAVSDQASWRVVQSLRQALEEARGSRAIPSILHQDVQHDVVLVYGAPQMVQHAPDADEHLVEVPRVPGSGTTPAQPLGELRADLAAPVPDTLMRH